MNQNRVKELEDAIGEILVLIEQLPCGIEYDADPNDTSPDDAIAFLGGLMWQICARVHPAVTKGGKHD